MNQSQAKRLKVGDTVVWEGGPIKGKVIERGYNAVKIEWSDGEISVIHHADAENVKREPRS